MHIKSMNIVSIRRRDGAQQGTIQYLLLCNTWHRYQTTQNLHFQIVAVSQLYFEHNNYPVLLYAESLSI